MFLTISSPVPRMLDRSSSPSGGAAGSQGGSQARTRAGSQRRSAPIKRVRDRIDAFGQQERGSGTDAVANIRRRSPGVPGGGFGGGVQSPQDGKIPMSQPLSMPVQGQSPALGQQGGGGAPVTDPNQLDRFINMENTLRNQRLGFGVDPQSLADIVQQRFESALPQLNANFENQAEQIARRTSALGRTGSGMVDREFADLNRQQRAARENLLGRLTFQGAQQDVGNDLQTQLARQQHLQGLQRREDMLARQAMRDRANQMRFLQRGFTSNPVGALQGAAATNILGAGEFGSNAGALSQQLGGTAQAGAAQQGGLAGILGPAVSQLFGGPSGGTPPFNPDPRQALPGGTTQLPVPDDSSIQGLLYDD